MSLTIIPEQSKVIGTTTAGSIRKKGLIEGSIAPVPAEEVDNVWAKLGIEKVY